MQADEINMIQFLTEEYELGLSFNYSCRYISSLMNFLPSHMLDANVVKKKIKRVYLN